METLKSAKFWLTVVALCIIAGAIFTNKVTGGEGIAAIMTVLGFGAGYIAAKTASSKAMVLIPLLVGSMAATAACSTTSAGQTKFDPGKAMALACSVTPAANEIHYAVCESLPEEKKQKCLEVQAQVKKWSGALLGVAGAVYGACKE